MYKIYKNKNKTNTNKANFNIEKVKQFRQNQPNYKLTPLYSWQNFAQNYGIKNLLIKDESKRFNLNSFKALGVSYAINCIKNKDDIYVTCTDGNHGKALAWYGLQTNHKVIVFMPKGSDQKRVEAIAKYGASVTITEMNYDDTVQYAHEYAKKHGYILVQDTDLNDYKDIPTKIIEGYSTIITEIQQQTNEQITHVFIQAGVGSLAQGIIGTLLQTTKQMPYIGIIEASVCPCIYESAKNNNITTIKGNPTTIMAGLNCGKPNTIFLPMLIDNTDWFFACSDDLTIRGMERSLKPFNDDQPFSGGESGAISLGLLEEILQTNPQDFHLDENSTVLIINTEGRLENQ